MFTCTKKVSLTAIIALFRKEAAPSKVKQFGSCRGQARRNTTEEKCDWTRDNYNNIDVWVKETSPHQQKKKLARKPCDHKEDEQRPP